MCVGRLVDHGGKQLKDNLKVRDQTIMKRLITLKRTAGACDVWPLLLLQLLLLWLISLSIIIISRLATLTSGIPEQHPRTDWFLAVADALE